MSRLNPTENIDVNFSAYVQNRKSQTEPHMEGGIPDYAYGSDFVLRQKIKAIPGFYKLVKAILSSEVPRRKQVLNLQSLKVGPSQFPDVYNMTVECARILGIGIPSVFISNDQTLNAYTVATEDDMPIVVINSGILERLTPAELKTVIGHECGHIHNNHTIFTYLANLIVNEDNGLIYSIPGVRSIFNLISLPLSLSLKAWSRAAEVTSDRAGIICGDDPLDSITAECKLIYGGAFNREANVDAVLKQYDAIKSTPVRFLEIEYTHPLSVKRIFAMKEFLNSEVLYQWRPEWKKADLKTISKQELDLKCEKYISVTKNEKRKG